VKAWCLLTHAEASPPISHRGQGDSLVPPYTRGNVSLFPSQRHEGHGESLMPVHTRGSVSLFLARRLTLRCSGDGVAGKVQRETAWRGRAGAGPWRWAPGPALLYGRYALTSGEYTSADKSASASM